ncbi:hypothetical protein IMSAGC012_01348 [Lachnospiraceae bacterium]|nr:hypothetical protein IMSAGC012_01348 [Lachnospiraceae bacterium]
MRRLSRKNQIEIGIMTLVFVIAAFFVYKTTILTRMILPRTETLVKAEEGKFQLLSDGDHIEQTFFYPSDELLSVGIRISLDEDVQEALLKEDKKRDLGTLHLKILDASDNLLMSADYAVFVLADDQNVVASFPGTQTGWENQKLTIVLDAERIHPDLDLKAGITTQAPDHTQLLINGEEKDMSLNIQTADRQFLYWKYWSVFGAALVYLLLLGTYLSLAVFRLKPEKVFLIAGSVLALLYLLLLPPISVPDEEAHFKQAYEYTNKIMGIPAMPGKIRMDAEDFHAMQMFETTPSLPEYDRLKENMMKTGRESGTVEVPHTDTRAPAVTYVPGIVGILAGRILGLNGLIVIYLGRICSIFAYLFMMYWFIRIMYFAKTAAFLIALLPMTIQQCCSYSYDSVVIEAAFLYIALLFRMMYEKKKVQKPQMFWYIVFAALLAVSKGGTYMPLCFLTLLIPSECFSEKKKKRMFIGCVAAVSAAAFLLGTLSSVLYVVNPTAEQLEGAYLAGENYGTAGLFSNPMEFVTLSVRTLFLNGDTFLETMLGMQLGWLDVNVSRVVIYGMLAMLLLSFQQIADGSRPAGYEVSGKEKLMYLTVIALSAGVVFVSMFISWTPRESVEIFGIQGRYFLPLLPLSIRLLRGRNLSIRTDMGRKFMFAAVCLQCVAIYGILMSLERVL